jgi:hypothetical protein
MKNILSQREVEEIINPYYDKLMDSMYKAFSDFQNIHRNCISIPNLDLNKRTIASLVHDFTQARIIEAFSGMDNVYIGKFNKIFGLVIENKVFIRFKKINPDFSTSNIPTKQTRDYEDQQIEFAGFPSRPVYLYAGYQLNSTWTDINNLFIICKEGKNFQWIKNLTSSYEQQSLTFDDMSIKVESESTNRVKPKESIRKVINSN